MFFKKYLQKLAIFLQLFWALFPGILLLSIAYLFFSNLIQGKDILITGLRSRQTGFFFTIALFFWVLVTWYTSRLIAYNNDWLFSITKEGLYHTPRILGYACFTVIIISIFLLESPLKNIYLIHIGILLYAAIVYMTLHPIFERIKNARERTTLINLRYLLWFLFFVTTAIMVTLHSITSYIIGLSVIQVGFLFLVITRRKISETNINTNNLRTVDQVSQNQWIDAADSNCQIFVCAGNEQRGKPHALAILHSDTLKITGKNGQREYDGNLCGKVSGGAKPSPVWIADLGDYQIVTVFGANLNPRQEFIKQLRSNTSPQNFAQIFPL